ncbi:MAG: AzlD domain-containing protein [Clostridia bacterium]|nr:AzlD domain-containing protein [Clostridia bacterium]
MKIDFIVYLAVMAAVTYLVRMLPLMLVKKKITNRFLVSFLYYIPYAVLSAMIIPACFYAAGHIVSVAVGFCVAFLLAFKGKSLLTVALSIAGTVCAIELIIKYLL